MDHRPRLRESVDADLRRASHQLSDIGGRRPGRDDPPPALVDAAREGDAVALEALLRHQHDRLYALCRRIAGNQADAQDACQEALIAIARGIRRFDARSTFATWAYRVTTNACLDELRRRKRRPEPGLPHEQSVVPGARLRPGAPGLADPAAAVARRIDIDTALKTLPSDFRAAVVLRDLCDLTYEEIAEVLDVPIGTVRSRIARGRAALIPLLAPPDGPEPGPGNPMETPERPSP